jgi:hypothetical protein
MPSTPNTAFEAGPLRAARARFMAAIGRKVPRASASLIDGRQPRGVEVQLLAAPVRAAEKLIIRPLGKLRQQKRNLNLLLPLLQVLNVKVGSALSYCA